MESKGGCAYLFCNRKDQNFLMNILVFDNRYEIILGSHHSIQQFSETTMI